MLSKFVFAASNPLHFAYYNRSYPGTAVIGSSRGLLQDYAEQLGFETDVVLHDVANTPEAIIKAAGKAGETYIAWKPTNTEFAVAGTSYELARKLESKVQIRTLLPVQLFPDFIIVQPEDVAALTHAHLQAQLGVAKFVLQIDASTGGTGTFTIDSQDTLEDILEVLIDSEQSIVASVFASGTPRGLQCVLQKGKLLMNPWWHKDLVGLPDICDMTQPGSRYCGAILENIPDRFAGAIKELLAGIEAPLVASGYEGVFGLDIVADEATGSVKLIEMNARFTAVSNLYASAMRFVGYATDFITAYVADLAGEVTKPQLPPLHAKLSKTYFYLKLQNKTPGPVMLNDAAQLGVYDEHIVYTRFGWGVDAIADDADIVVIPQAAHHVARKPGDRTFSIIGVGDPVASGSLDAHMAVTIDALNQQFLTPAV